MESWSPEYCDHIAYKHRVVLLRRQLDNMQGKKGDTSITSTMIIREIYTSMLSFDLKETTDSLWYKPRL